jgi:ubiquinone/menaquinone biosynthesis C-methylase UbiE
MEARVGTEEFGPVAPIYDELMDNVPYRMWVGYYLLLLSHQGVRPKQILDVCCGTGTVAELLTEEGFQIEGFDLSEAMITQAREKAKLGLYNIRYEVADAATFDMGRQYEAAFSFFDSLNYILEPENLQKAFHRVAAHLPEGASLIFDLNTEYAFEKEMFTQKRLSQKAKLRYDWTGHWDPETKLIRVDMKFWKDGVELHETHRQRAYPLGDVRDMLHEAGFEQVQMFNSYTLDPVREKSDRVHVICLRG